MAGVQVAISPGEVRTITRQQKTRENLRQTILYWLPLVLVIACCGLLLIAWAFVVPIFESPDEPHHWKNAEYIHSHWTLPPYNSDYLEAPQPPLY